MFSTIRLTYGRTRTTRYGSWMASFTVDLPGISDWGMSS